MSDVTLSKSVRANLLHLQNTAKMMETTQERLATGKKVNSALDNPSNFFTAESLNARAADIGTLLDSMSNGIRTIEAADNGLTAMTKTIESMQSTLRQARQDKSFEMSSYTLGSGYEASDKLTFSGGAFDNETPEVDLTTAQGMVTGTAFSDLNFDLNADDGYDGTLGFQVAVNGGATKSVQVTATDANTLSVSIDGSATTFDVDDVEAVTAGEFTQALNAAFSAEGAGVTAGVSGGALTLTADNAAAASDAAVTLSDVSEDLAGASDTGLNGGTQSTTNITDRTVDDLVNAINNDSDLKGKIRASNDRGQLRIENQSTQELDIAGIDSSGTIDGTATDPVTIDGNMTRAGLAEQFNSLVSELDTLAEDASFNGVNLLRGDELRIVFNESGSSEIRVTTKGSDGKPQAVNSGTLGIERIDADSLDGDEDIDTLLAGMKSALDAVRGQSSNLGSNLSTVQNREDFTKEMINTLETGASNLTLADTNEEAANMLALQTRQQLSQTALSLASDADQAVLRLFG